MSRSFTFTAKKMKNIQVIVDALTCTFEIFAATEEEFSLIYPSQGQDVEFVSDLK